MTEDEWTTPPWKIDGDLIPPNAVEYDIEGKSDPTKISIRFDPTFQRMSGIAVHGHKRFDVPFISQVTETLWQGGCESGLILPDNIDHVVSLYPWERYTINGVIKSELYVKMYDSNDEVNSAQVWQLANHVLEAQQTGTVLVHCQAGLNRSSLVAAASLILEGYTANDAIELLRAKRSDACLCNPTFEAWLREAESNDD